jgi:integrase
LRTAALYEDLLRLHIARTLGNVDLVDLTPGRVRTWRKDLLDSGVGEVTVAKCYRLLRSVLNTAVEDDELIRRVPCRIKGAGAERSPERAVASPEQVGALVEAVPKRWRALVLLAVACSLRWGELLDCAGSARTRSDETALASVARS